MSRKCRGNEARKSEIATGDCIESDAKLCQENNNNKMQFDPSLVTGQLLF